MSQETVSRRPVAWLLIIAVWVATPYNSPHNPNLSWYLYVVLLAVTVVYGLATAVSRRDWLLYPALILTLFAWPIMTFAVFLYFA
ncbi:hypothetical protein [Corynebacterium sanguinis]|uniref:hypothetical protein n=1 Tax=Corynebacterium sanguinis TaxID=2594913 RepID=UPI0010AAAB85|nr:hypothetical protein [Corynebacterium sanguinis]MCT1413514.1 hypothetical protein [Corynebacterium sanguinis]MCT1612865.1 hypothetical protein [Corynebacterium sanguinis]MCT1695986.1 hypothetical protein [Corynebacterium sanguinis]MDN8621286.1 hypothetical protein [Corynebacterium sanguinis]QDR78146.1 hypothetical protein E3227_08905 [Corynebacterium sanguinis]